MGKLGRSLEDLFSERNITRKYSPKTVCQIGIKMLDCLQLLHQSGFLHNDLKLENIMVGDGDGQNMHEVRLIDFGLATDLMEGAKGPMAE